LQYLLYMLVFCPATDVLQKKLFERDWFYTVVEYSNRPDEVEGVFEAHPTNLLAV
jgi:hypothetical protein